MEVPFLIAASLFLAGFVMGVSGFGFAIMAIGMMSFFWPIPKTVALIFVYSLPINMVLLFQLRNHIVVRRILLQVVAFIPGAVIGAFVFLNVREALLKQIVGAVLIVFGFWSLQRKTRLIPKSRFLGGLAGFLAGVLGGAVYMPGPPMIVYQTMTETDRFRFKTDLQLFFFFTNFILLAAFLYCGLDQNIDLLRSLLFSPFAVFGLLGGSFLFQRLNNETFKQICSILVGVIGVILFLIHV